MKPANDTTLEHEEGAGRMVTLRHARRCGWHLQALLNVPDGALRELLLREARWYAATASAELDLLTESDAFVEKMRPVIALLVEAIDDLDGKAAS